MTSIVRDLLRSPGWPLSAKTLSFIDSRFDHDFSLVRVHTDAPQQIQTKLTINWPGDKYEKEADRVAEQVMHLSGSALQNQVDELQGLDADVSPSTTPAVQSPAIQMTPRCYPVNGVIRSNAYDSQIEICIDGRILTKPAGWTSDPGGLVPYL